MKNRPIRPCCLRPTKGGDFDAEQTWIGYPRKGRFTEILKRLVDDTVEENGAILTAESTITLPSDRLI